VGRFQRARSPCIGRLADLQMEMLTVPGLARVPQNASVMFSTCRTLTPAMWILISASSTNLSRRASLAVYHSPARNTDPFAGYGPAHGARRVKKGEGHEPFPPGLQRFRVQVVRGNC